MVAARRAYDRSKQLESCSTMRCPRPVKTGRWQQLAEARQLAARLVSPRINPARLGCHGALATRWETPSSSSSQSLCDEMETPRCTPASS